MSEAQSQLKEISDEVDKAINTSSNKKAAPTATAVADVSQPQFFRQFFYQLFFIRL
jgi:hypothetical protein